MAGNHPNLNRRVVQVVSHGPSCFDGVMAAATVARFYEGSHRVVPIFAANGESDEKIQALKARAGGVGEEIWITDLSWNSTATAEHLRALAAAGVSIFWIDHHRTAVSRADAPEFKVPFRNRVLSERYSAARLTFNFLKRKAAQLPAADRKAFERIQPLVELADDHDRWVKRFPASADWALAIQTLGGAQAYKEILRLDEPVMTPRLKAALAQGREAMEKSVALARATLIDRPLSNGLKVRTACCFGYSSEVAAELYKDQTKTVIALFDLRSQGVSLLRSADCEVDLSQTARGFGGGGHAAAAGFTRRDLAQAPAERLASILGDRLQSLPSR
jgi:oligoribonuclease NrnB/cAMP/cGMP phosphodiesterase (DHH superfamily)